MNKNAFGSAMRAVFSRLYNDALRRMREKIKREKEAQDELL